jgi:hypothetical protein
VVADRVLHEVAGGSELLLATRDLPDVRPEAVVLGGEERG